MNEKSYVQKYQHYNTLYPQYFDFRRKKYFSTLRGALTGEALFFWANTHAEFLNLD